MTIQRRLYGHATNVEIRPLDPEKAVQAASDLLGEILIFSVLSPLQSYLLLNTQSFIVSIVILFYARPCSTFIKELFFFYFLCYRLQQLLYSLKFKEVPDQKLGKKRQERMSSRLGFSLFPFVLCWSFGIYISYSQGNFFELKMPGNSSKGAYIRGKF